MDSRKKVILSFMALKGYDRQKMAELMDISLWKFRKKLNYPGDITLDEMNQMIKILDIDRPGDVFYDL